MPQDGVWGLYKKKVFYKYKGVSEQPEFAIILAECEEAYNEARRVKYHSKFNFYDGADVKLPLCLYAYVCEIINMMEEIVAGAKINDETKDRIVKMLKAKRLRRS